MKGFRHAGVCAVTMLLATAVCSDAWADRVFGTYTATTTVAGTQTLEYCMDTPAPGNSPRILVLYHHGFQDYWSTANQLGDTTTTGPAGCSKDDPNTVMHDIRAADTANQVVTVAFEYPNDQGFPALAGAQASNQLRAQILADPRFAGIQRVVYFGVSMGGAVSGTALSENTRAGGAPISDWVLAEPVTDVFETYSYAMLANLVAPSLGFGAATSGIQQDTGQANPSFSALWRRSPFWNAAAIGKSLTGRTTIIAGAFDAEVTPDQAIKLNTNLGLSGSPSHLTIVTKPAPAGSSDFSLVTVLCGVLGLNASGCNSLPGHEDANDPVGPVMKEARSQLLNVIFGATPFVSGTELFDSSTGKRTQVR